MRRSGLIAVLLLCCALAVWALGCRELGTAENPPKTTAPPHLTTAALTTTTEPRLSVVVQSATGTTRPHLKTVTTAAPTAPPTHWTETEPSDEDSSFQFRVFHSMVCDSATGKVYVFGGDDFSEPSRNDLWVYDLIARTWTELDSRYSHPTQVAPSDRENQSMVYDPSKHRIFLFGGYDRLNGGPLGDLWAYDPGKGKWTELHPAGDTPAARYSHAMVYDSHNGKIILFGGFSRLIPAPSGYAPRYESSNDLWSYDPGRNEWTELHPAGPVPSERAGHLMVYDPTIDKVILFEGFQATPDNGTVDLWSYDPSANTWTKLDPEGAPGYLSGAAMVHDPACGLTILFGGAVDKGMAVQDFPDTLWAYDSAANTWNKLVPAGGSPGGRAGHAMVYDPKIAGVVMFGGSNYQEGELSGTWTLTP